MIFGKNKLLIIIFLLVFFMPFAYSQAASSNNTDLKGGSWIGNYTHKTWNFLKSFYTEENKEKTKKILGMTFSWSSFGYILIGLLAGFILWISNLIANFYSKVKEARIGIRSKAFPNPFKDMGDRWLNFIAGSLWKVILIGIGYFVIMQIPIINRIIQAITLDLVVGNPFLKAVVLALEIGYLPSLAEYFWKMRTEIKYEKKLDKMRKIGASVSKEEE